MSAKILLVEDDLFLQDGLRELLLRDGYTLTVAATAAEAEHAMRCDSFDLAILDIRLPDGNGLSLCRQWRAEGRDLRILFLTACDDELEIVRGLDAGGDDYITKPFRLQELSSRIRAQLRRTMPSAYQGRHIRIDFIQHSVSLDGKPLSLTPTELQLLTALVRHSGQTLTRSQLLQQIWDHNDEYIDDNTLSVHISRLREKVGVSAISTVRGIGYRWTEDPQ